MAVKKKPAKKTIAKKSVAVKKTAAGKKTKPKTAAKKAKKIKPIKQKKKRKPETLMCFLTTACVRYYNLRDDGYELNTLRNYRDNYLKSSEAGKRLVEQYYRLSPQIVMHIENDSRKSDVYAFIHNSVLRSCAQIDKLRYQAAQTTYKKMVEHLLKRYHLSAH